MRTPSIVVVLALLASSQYKVAASPLAKKPNLFSRLVGRIWTRKTNETDNNDNDMGQAVRVMKYDRAANVANAIPALNFQGKELKWHRLDDGVMGGRSETEHITKDGLLSFCGTINTNGGGFTSIRAPFEGGLPKDTEAIRIKFRGDGKTYKLLLSKGGSGGGFMRNDPSWQADIPTENRNEGMQEMQIPVDTLQPSFGPRAVSDEDRKKYKFDPTEMSELGLMLSLKLSDGRPNPKETFGEGIFPFSLLVESIEPVLAN